MGKLKGLSGGGDDSQMNHAEEMKRKSEAYHFDPNQNLPPEVLRNLKEVLRFHDDVLRDIIKKMEMVPGLTDLIDGLSNALNACELSLLDAICSLKPPPSCVHRYRPIRRGASYWPSQTAVMLTGNV